MTLKFKNNMQSRICIIISLIVLYSSCSSSNSIPKDIELIGLKGPVKKIVISAYKDNQLLSNDNIDIDMYLTGEEALRSYVGLPYTYAQLFNSEFEFDKHGNSLDSNFYYYNKKYPLKKENLENVVVEDDKIVRVNDIQSNLVRKIKRKDNLIVEVETHLVYEGKEKLMYTEHFEYDDRGLLIRQKHISSPRSAMKDFIYELDILERDKYENWTTANYISTPVGYPERKLSIKRNMTYHE